MFYPAVPDRKSCAVMKKVFLLEYDIFQRRSGCQFSRKLLLSARPCPVHVDSCRRKLCVPVSNSDTGGRHGYVPLLKGT